MPTELDNWVAQIRAGEVRAVSRAITAVENREPAADALLDRLFPHTGDAYFVGVTGAPGTGKSTLVDRLASHYRALGQAVGILAVDPTSPYSGGAILGDRIRMQRHFGDAGVFIRSMATRGFLGGLASATSDVALVLAAAGKQIVFIETVGVGQDEVDVVRLADCTLVVLVPGLGDDVQSMKAGLMEVADLFIINKAEREGADRLEQQLQAMLHLLPAEAPMPPVLRTVAIESRGIAELAAAIEAFRGRAESAGSRRDKRRDLWKWRLIVMLGEQLVGQALARPDGERLLGELAAQVADRRKSPGAAVRELSENHVAQSERIL